MDVSDRSAECTHSHIAVASARARTSAGGPSKHDEARAGGHDHGGLSRYFGHAGEAHQHSLRGSSRRARGTGARVTGGRCRPVLVLLGGESGVGKTRLVAEFERRLRTTPSRCVARRSSRATASCRTRRCSGPCVLWYAARDGARGAQLGQPCPARALLPGLEDGGSVRDRPGPSAQLRLFEALLELLDLLSEARPTGPDPRGHALGGPLDQNLRVVPRSEPEAGARDARAQLPGRRAPSAARAQAAVVRARAARSCAADRALPVRSRRAGRGARGHPRRRPSIELVERLFTRSEGNPLYTEELLAAGLDGRGAAPQSLRDAFLLRIERLSPDAQRAARRSRSAGVSTRT